MTLLRALGLVSFDTDNYSGSVTVEPLNAILYIADSSILFHQTGNYDYIYILTVNGFVNVIN